LTPLDTTAESTRQPPEKGKSKVLLAAYSKASEAQGLDHFKQMLAEHQKALDDDLVEREEREAEREARKAKKANRKSSEAAASTEDADGMDVDDDTPAEKPKSKKRKKATDDGEIEEKVSIISWYTC